MSGWSPHLARVRSISSGGPHRWEWSCRHVVESTELVSDKSEFLILLRCIAILFCIGFCAAKYRSRSSEGSIHLGTFLVVPLRFWRSRITDSSSAQQSSHAFAIVVFSPSSSCLAETVNVAAPACISLCATSRLDCSIWMVGFGPSKRLRPRIVHGSCLLSVVKANADSRDLRAVVSGVVISSSQVGIVLVFPSVRAADMI